VTVMPFRFACPECGIETLVDDEFAGHTGPCAGCGKTITVPFGTGLSAVTTRKSTGRYQWRTVSLVVVSSIVAALFVFSVLLWLVFPLLQRGTAVVQRMQCQSNLKQIAQALKQYELEHGTLPPAYLTDDTGKPVHSWRVLILPQLGHRGLFERYRFDEPWDGPNNSTLVNQMPDVFACPADPDARTKGETSYMAVVGPGTVFPGKTAVSTGMIRDDHSQTILIAETPAAGVVWMQPKDLDATRMKFAVNGAMSGEIGSLHPDGANVVTVDGNPRFVSELFLDEYLHGMSTANGGEDIPHESLE
jgi:type II secretory pathway pseudopilin PulG